MLTAHTSSLHPASFPVFQPFLCLLQSATTVLYCTVHRAQPFLALLPPLDHDNMVTKPRFHFPPLGAVRRTRFELVCELFKFARQAAARLPAEGPACANWTLVSHLLLPVDFTMLQGFRVLENKCTQINNLFVCVQGRNQASTQPHHLICSHRAQHAAWRCAATGSGAAAWEKAEDTNNQ